jgi:hypothetical protein
MLLNLSNHPSSSWGEAQMQAAQTHYGHVEDMPFPHIDPESGYEQVNDLANQVFEDIKKRNPSAVHLMGELTFCFILANILKDSGIECVASTTQRLVEENNGQKISTFKFVGFRQYYILDKNHPS